MKRSEQSQQQQVRQSSDSSSLDKELETLREDVWLAAIRLLSISTVPAGFVPLTMVWGSSPGSGNMEMELARAQVALIEAAEKAVALHFERFVWPADMLDPIVVGVGTAMGGGDDKIRSVILSGTLCVPAASGSDGWPRHREQSVEVEPVEPVPEPCASLHVSLDDGDRCSGGSLSERLQSAADDQKHRRADQR